MFDPSAGETGTLTATLPANVDYWRAEVINDLDGSRVTSWSSSYPKVNLSWNGKDALGTEVEDGAYSLILTAFVASAPPVQKRLPMTVVKGSPQGLALLAPIETDTVPLITQYVASISASFKSMHQTDASFHGIILNSRKRIPKANMLKIRGWLKDSVVDFYYYGHGSDAITEREFVLQRFSWGGMTIWPDLFTSMVNRVDAAEQKNPERDCILHRLIGGRAYNFVMIDCCKSAGDFDANPPRFDTATWAEAFSLNNNNFLSCFWGWFGCSAGLSRLDANGNPSGEDEWSVWRKEFWRQLGINGRLVIDAGSFATAKAKLQPNLAALEPWDQFPDGHFRAALFGNTFLP